MYNTKSNGFAYSPIIEGASTDGSLTSGILMFCFLIKFKVTADYFNPSVAF